MNMCTCMCIYVWCAHMHTCEQVWRPVADYPRSYLLRQGLLLGPELTNLPGFCPASSKGALVSAPPPRGGF